MAVLVGRGSCTGCSQHPSRALIFQYFEDGMRLRHKREVAFWPDLSEVEEDSVDGGEGGDVLKRS